MSCLRPLTAAALWLAVVATGGVAAAQTEEPSAGSIGGATIVGVGARACSVWVADRMEDGQEAHSDDAWVEGYLSALASVLPHPDVLSHTDSPSILIWTDQYCTQNPSDSIGKAATALFLQLRAAGAAQ